jgi:hypothetical protein
VLSIFLFLLLAAVVLGLVGVVVHGLIWLLLLGILVVLIDFAFLGTGLRRKRIQRPTR